VYHPLSPCPFHLISYLRRNVSMLRFLVVIVVLAGAALLFAQTKKPAQAPAAVSPTPAKPAGPDQISGKPKTTASGVYYWDTKVGTGKEATVGRNVSVHYTGWLTNGKKFDSSRDRDEPFDFVLGAHQVITGWDEGVVGMKVGGKRQLRIPPAAGYGTRGAPPVIPPNATLVFDVELLEVR
jgi:FKBP-type peptidyl-prolyl cis-trans isomerase FkpA